jgi:hypothetical protein
LKEYHNNTRGIEHLPPDEYRLHIEEIKSAIEYERESQIAKAK